MINNKWPKSNSVVTGDKRFWLPPELPVFPDMAKDLLRHRHPEIRYPLGMLKLSSQKLLDTGFKPVIGVRRAIDDAIAHFSMI
jgi:hypothetical protein